MPRPVDNPPNPWSSTHIEWLEEPPPATLTFYEEQARSIVTENDSPDIPFRFSVNPYRGCIHACAYCYARPTHQYLGFGAGTDFDRKIVVKINAPALLRKELERPSWTGERIAFSGNTDCYQAAEASFRLTRQCLEVCLEFQNPVGIITKSALVRRDLDLLVELHRRARCRVNISVAFADDDASALIEPYASRPSRRFETLATLADAGIPVGVVISPVIPGLNDSDLPELLERARAAGAAWASMTPLRLPAEVLPVFEARLAEAFPGRAAKVLGQVREMRGGKMNVVAFGARMTARGPRWEVIERLFELHARRLGLAGSEREEEGPSPFRRPTRQGTLFDL